MKHEATPGRRRLTKWRNLAIGLTNESPLTSWAPIPLRLIVGYGFMEHGFAKLARGADAFPAILQELGVPAPHLMGWLTIFVEIVGGLAVLLGAAVPLVSLPMAAVLLVAAITVHFFSLRVQFNQASGRDCRRRPVRASWLRDGLALPRLPYGSRLGWLGAVIGRRARKLKERHILQSTAFRRQSRRGARVIRPMPPTRRASSARPIRGSLATGHSIAIPSNRRGFGNRNHGRFRTARPS